MKRRPTLSEAAGPCRRRAGYRGSSVCGELPAQRAPPVDTADEPPQRAAVSPAGRPVHTDDMTSTRSSAASLMNRNPFTR